MDWSKYVEFTATTALPGTDNPEYLRLGILEEAHEALAAYCSLQAALVGRQKRVLRGDPSHVLQAKTDAAEIARRQLVEEIGDLAWYVARLDDGGKGPWFMVTGNLADVLTALQRFEETPTFYNASRLLSCLLALADCDQAAVLTANVAKLTARKAAGTIQGEGRR